jgi:hypothetical protein
VAFSIASVERYAGKGLVKTSEARRFMATNQVVSSFHIELRCGLELMLRQQRVS